MRIEFPDYLAVFPRERQNPNPRLLQDLVGAIVLCLQLVQCTIVFRVVVVGEASGEILLGPGVGIFRIVGTVFVFRMFSEPAIDLSQLFPRPIP